MAKIKTLVVASAVVLGLASTALAGTEHGPKVTLGGTMDTTLGTIKQKSFFKKVTPGDAESGTLVRSKLVQDTKVMVKVDGTTPHMNYGGLIKFNADTSLSKHSDSNVAEQTMVYMGGMFGTVQAGSYSDPTKLMQVGANTVAKAAGGVSSEGSAIYWYNPNVDPAYTAAPLAGDAFFQSGDLFTNQYTGTNGGGKRVNAAKITYLTPKMRGFQAAVSYTPDLDIHGTIALANSVVKEATTYKNVVSGGIHYETMMRDVGFKFAVLGQSASAKGALAKLRGIEAGAAFHYMGVEFAGSYGDLDRSGQVAPATVKGKRSKYWTAGIGYEHAGFGASLTHMESKRGVSEQAGANRLRLTSLGVQYKAAPGFMPYAEATMFNGKVKGVPSGTPPVPFAQNKGTVLLLGTKLHF